MRCEIVCQSLEHLRVGRRVGRAKIVHRMHDTSPEKLAPNAIRHRLGKVWILRSQHPVGQSRSGVCPGRCLQLPTAKRRRFHHRIAHRMVHGSARCVVKIFRAGRYRWRDARALALHLGEECRELVKVGLAPLFVWMMMTPRALKAHAKEHLTEQRRERGRFTARTIDHGWTHTVRAALGRQDLANHPVVWFVFRETLANPVVDRVRAL